MTASVLESPPSLLGEPARSRSGDGREPAGRRGPVDGRGLTLEERLEGAWRAVQAEGLAECPVCHARMDSEGAAARCSGCGSTLG